MRPLVILRPIIVHCFRPMHQLGFLYAKCFRRLLHLSAQHNWLLAFAAWHCKMSLSDAFVRARLRQITLVSTNHAHTFSLKCRVRLFHWCYLSMILIRVPWCCIKYYAPYFSPVTTAIHAVWGFWGALDVCSRRGAIQIHVYLYLYLYLLILPSASSSPFSHLCHPTKG